MIKRIDFRTAVMVAPVREVNAELTFAELAAAWLATVHVDNEHQQLKKWVHGFGDRIAWSITTVELEAACQAMLNQGYAASTVNRNMSTLGSMYKWVIAKHRAPAGFVSPTRGVRRYEEAIRVVEHSSEDLAKLRAVAMTCKDKRFTIFVHLVLDTGARKSELLERTWGDFDLDRGTVLLRTSKTGRPRMLHFTAATAALIQRLVPNRPQSALVFPGRDPSQPINYRAAWRSLTKSVGLRDMRMHDARHDKARRLLMAGVALPVAASVMGHSSRVLERRYGHLAIVDQRAAVEAAWAA